MGTRQLHQKKRGNGRAERVARDNDWRTGKLRRDIQDRVRDAILQTLHRVKPAVADLASSTRRVVDQLDISQIVNPILQGQRSAKRDNDATGGPDAEQGLMALILHHMNIRQFIGRRACNASPRVIETGAGIAL